MLIEYGIWLIALPFMCLWKIGIRKQKEELYLLDKNDTCCLRGLAAWFVIAAHLTDFTDSLIGGVMTA